MIFKWLSLYLSSHSILHINSCLIQSHPIIAFLEYEVVLMQISILIGSSIFILFWVLYSSDSYSTCLFQLLNAVVLFSYHLLIWFLHLFELVEFELCFWLILLLTTDESLHISKMSGSHKKQKPIKRQVKNNES